MIYNPTVGMRVRYRMTPANPEFNGKIATIIEVRGTEIISWRLRLMFDEFVCGKRDWNSSVDEYDPLITSPEEEAIYQDQQFAFKVAEAKRLAELADARRRQAHAMKHF